MNCSLCSWAGVVFVILELQAFKQLAARIFPRGENITYHKITEYVPKFAHVPPAYTSKNSAFQLSGKQACFHFDTYFT